MPGLTLSSRPESSPSSFTVKRRPAVVGAADTEYGCDCHQSSGVSARMPKY